jgi:hypothetical protein
MLNIWTFIENNSGNSPSRAQFSRAAGLFIWQMPQGPDTALSMKFGPLPFNSAFLGMVATFVRARRSSTEEVWPEQKLAAWRDVPPKHGLPLRLEFRRLAQAFKAYKIATANSEPRVWCRCRYREMHELEFWFATERDPTRVAMLVQLHGLGSACGDTP